MVGEKCSTVGFVVDDINEFGQKHVCSFIRTKYCNNRYNRISAVFIDEKIRSNVKSLQPIKT